MVAALAHFTLAAATVEGTDGEIQPPMTAFDRDVQPILRKRCASCHNAERPRGELDLTSYAGVMAGGAGGKAVMPRNPEESPVYTLPAHLEEPNMPPNAPMIPRRELDVLQRWIEGGLVEHAGDSGPKPVVGTKPDHPARPAGGLVPPVVSTRAAAITALAVSPARPIAAASLHTQVLVYDFGGRKILGALPFPEGDVFAMAFSHDGRTLLAAGGRGAESGKIVLFDTSTWGRLSTLGDEFDTILAAGLSPDGSRAVLGGPGRVVKVLANPRGETLHTFRKPTDWVTAASFSPDGLLVAAGDRFGGLFLWEVRTGKEFLSLRGHTKAVTAIGWLSDGDAMVTSSEDGRVQIWNLHTGQAASGWDAHPGGVLGIDVHRSGRIASAGRDRRIKVWQGDGRLAADLGPAADQATRVAWTPDGRSIISGDCTGEVRVWSLDGPSYTILPTPVSPKPTALALVVPELVPARPYAPKPSPEPFQPRGDSTPAGTEDDLDAAIASARTAAAAAEKALADLSRLARSRAVARPGRESRSGHSVAEALEAANAGLASLRAALANDPDNETLTRAITEAERAVRDLERKRNDRRPASSRR
jgi:hypothetical protein